MGSWPFVWNHNAGTIFIYIYFGWLMIIDSIWWDGPMSFACLALAGQRNKVEEEGSSRALFLIQKWTELQSSKKWWRLEVHYLYWFLSKWIFHFAVVLFLKTFITVLTFLLKFSIMPFCPLTYLIKAKFYLSFAFMLNPSLSSEIMPNYACQP